VRRNGVGGDDAECDEGIDDRRVCKLMVCEH
jgi:hypothetical protein